MSNPRTLFGFLRSSWCAVFVGIGLLAVCCVDSAVAQIPAFPGAEGEGMYVSGGRGGDVYHVTSLADSGPGSLREGITTAPGGTMARTIVFDVSGRIQLASDLRIKQPNITIAGQTAPGQGICITNYRVQVAAENVILRHLRIRPGDASMGPAPGFHEDALSTDSSHVIVDHCSTSWSVDECLSAAASNLHNVTVQYCTMIEGLDQTGLHDGEWDPNYFPGGPSHHGYGSLVKPISGDGVVSYHHNLWAMNYNRNPAVGTYDAANTMKADIRNNVLYNNRYNGYSSGASQQLDLNYVGNYIIAGPETNSGWVSRAFACYEANNVYVYQSGNLVDWDKDLARDGVNTGWSMFSGTYTQVFSEFPMRPVTTHTAEEAYDLIMQTAGAFFWNRDSVDARLFEVNIPNLTGAVIDSQNEVGGYPFIAEIHRLANWDTDLDGMPDLWELAYGTDPNVADNNGYLHGSFYTNLEEYLAYAAIPEPGTVSLLAGGVLGLLCRHRPRQRRD